MDSENSLIEVVPEAREVASPRVSVIVVTYRSTKELPACAESVLRQRIPTELFIVDNASPDGTPGLVAEYGAKYPNVHPILNSENIGLAAGNNRPLGQCQGDYVLILNPDTILREDTLRKMVEYLDDHSDVGVLGPKNLYEDGKAHVSYHHAWGLMHVLFWRVLPHSIIRPFYDKFTTYRLQDVMFVSGACLLIRRKIFEQIGGYDEQYFLTIEDVVDLCVRARNAGGRVVFFPDSEVIHFNGRSGAQAPYVALWQANRGSVYHFLKHRGMAMAIVVTFVLCASAAIRSVLEAIVGVFVKRYRLSARFYSKIFWDLLARNPIFASRGRTMRLD